MKRTIFTIAMSFMLFFSAMASDNKMESTEAYHINVNTEALTRSLETNKDQNEAIANIMEIFTAQMENTRVEENATTRAKMLDNTIDTNLKYMRQVLSNEQYKKYLAILNSTMRNRGLK